MHTADHDLIVVGLGAMGSAAAYHAAQQGDEVLGIEQQPAIPHRQGSSHGETRIIRKGYFEGDAYIPLLQRSYELWERLQQQAGEQLLYPNGILVAGPEDSDHVTDTLASCQRQDLPHAHLSASTVNDRFPGYELPPDYHAVHQPDGGYLACEDCISAHLQQARQAGATIHTGETVERWDSTTTGVRVMTDRGRYEADRLVIAGGAWIPGLVPRLRDPLQVDLYDVIWMQPSDTPAFQPEKFPSFIIETEETGYYGFPHHERPGFKFGGEEPVAADIDPDSIDRDPAPDDDQRLRPFAERFLPTGAGPTLDMERCLITESPDHDFIIDTLPDHPDVVIGAGFSGHGFKMSAAIGEILATLGTGGHTDQPIDPFSISRL